MSFLATPTPPPPFPTSVCFRQKGEMHSVSEGSWHENQEENPIVQMEACECRDSRGYSRKVGIVRSCLEWKEILL